MRIGIVCPYDMGSPGGVQQLTSELAARLRSLGEDVVVVAAGRLDLAGASGIDPSVVPVGRPIFVPGNRSRVPLTLSPLAWARARSVLREVDVIHIHEPMLPLLGWAGLSVDRPLVVTFHADAPGWVQKLYRWTPLVGRKLRPSVLTAASKTAAAAIPDSWGYPVIVPNAINVASYHIGTQRMKHRVAFLGRDEPRKGLDILLSAWPVIRSEVPNAELIVMGATRPSGPEGVTFHGRVDGGAKRRLLASSSIFVAPNTGGESFGMVILEAMAAGCAVVVSDLPPFLDVIGEAGRSFPVDDNDALTRVVIELLQAEDVVEKLRDLATSHVEQYDWGVVVEQYRDMYYQVAS